jgi:hypothetical protein
MFQLKARLERAKVAHLNDAMPFTGAGGKERNLNSDEEDISDNEGENPTNDTPNPKIRVQHGRKRTHNEQLFVAPCGVIIARETFYGAEAVGSVVVRAL